MNYKNVHIFLFYAKIPFWPTHETDRFCESLMIVTTASITASVEHVNRVRQQSTALHLSKSPHLTKAPLMADTPHYFSKIHKSKGI